MSFQHFLLGYKNVALIVPMVGANEFVEYHNIFLQVPVHVMQMEVGVAGIPPRTYLNQALDGRGHLREGHPVLILRKDRK